MSSKQVRRLAAVFVADAVGYSDLMRTAEEQTLQQYKNDLGAVFVPQIAEHRGRIVKTTGDGLLAEFASVVDCLQSAMAIQQLLLTQQPEPGGKSHLIYRIGINLGDIIVEANDIYGDGVNMAARLQGLAEPGGIALSADAYRQVVGKVDAKFQDLGEREVKGNREPLHVFRIVSETGVAEAPRPRGVATRQPPSTAPSVAVLPFDSLNEGTDKSYFSDGITNDILTELSKFSELFVIASHTVFTYKGRSIRIEDVGRELGVRYVVEGSVQRGGDRIRINVQLIEAASGRHLWAERYDRSAREFFRLQDEIVHTIVATLVLRLDMSEHQRVMHKEPNSLEAYDVYLRGRAAWRDWTSQSNRLAQTHFSKAVEIDPTFASAYGYWSYTIVQAWLSGWDLTPTRLQEARELALKAVGLDPGNFENHWSLAMAYLYGREFDKAMAAFSRSVDMNPNCAGLLVDMAEALVFLGKCDEAMVQIERAMRLNPIYPDSYLWTVGVTHYHAGRFSECLTALGQMNNPPNLCRRHEAAANIRLQRLEEARSIAKLFLQNDPQYTLARENLWPYRDPAMLDTFVADLRAAGFPE